MIIHLLLLLPHCNEWMGLQLNSCLIVLLGIERFFKTMSFCIFFLGFKYFKFRFQISICNFCTHLVWGYSVLINTQSVLQSRTFRSAFKFLELLSLYKLCLISLFQLQLTQNDGKSSWCCICNHPREGVLDYYGEGCSPLVCFRFYESKDSLLHGDGIDGWEGMSSLFLLHTHLMFTFTLSLHISYS